MRILIIDDMPDRYGEFCRILEEVGWAWLITHDRMVYSMLHFDALLIDYDMPGMNGSVHARLMGGLPFPVIVTSCNAEKRNEIALIFSAKGCPVIVNPADHQGCEKEWYWWLRGCVDTTTKVTP